MHQCKQTVYMCSESTFWANKCRRQIVSAAVVRQNPGNQHMEYELAIWNLVSMMLTNSNHGKQTTRAHPKKFLRNHYNSYACACSGSTRNYKFWLRTSRTITGRLRKCINLGFLPITPDYIWNKWIMIVCRTSSLLVTLWVTWFWALDSLRAMNYGRPILGSLNV